MKKIFLIILSLILISCTGNYKVKNYKNEIPKWYVENSESRFKFFGKSQSDSESLEIALRKAEVLAVGDALFKIKSNDFLFSWEGEGGNNGILEELLGIFWMGFGWVIGGPQRGPGNAN